MDLLQRMASKGYTRPYYIELSKPDDQRTLDQNDLMHPLIRQIAKHMHDHGAEKRSEDWWKRYLVALHGGQEIVAGDNGTLVFMNKSPSTSSMSKVQGSDFIEWLYAYGIDKGMIFDE